MTAGFYILTSAHILLMAILKLGFPKKLPQTWVPTHSHHTSQWINRDQYCIVCHQRKLNQQLGFKKLSLLASTSSRGSSSSRNVQLRCASNLQKQPPQRQGCSETETKIQECIARTVSTYSCFLHHKTHVLYHVGPVFCLALEPSPSHISDRFRRSHPQGIWLAKAKGYYLWYCAAHARYGPDVPQSSMYHSLTVLLNRHLNFLTCSWVIPLCHSYLIGSNIISSAEPPKFLQVKTRLLKPSSGQS